MKITLNENELMIDGEGDTLYPSGKHSSATDCFSMDLGDDMKHIKLKVTGFVINMGGRNAIYVPAPTLIEQ